MVSANVAFENKIFFFVRIILQAVGKGLDGPRN